MLQRKRHIKIELCVRLIVLPLLHVSHVVRNSRSVFRCLGTDAFHEKAEHESFTVADCVVVTTSKIKIPRCRLADYVKKLRQKAWYTCSTVIFPRSTNQSIDWWCCRCRCRCRLPSKQMAAAICDGTRRAFEDTKEM